MFGFGAHCRNVAAVTGIVCGWRLEVSAEGRAQATWHASQGRPSMATMLKWDDMLLNINVI